MGWYLNKFLTSWREEVNSRFPHRGRSSDGTVGDPAHQSRASEHNPDTDGSVDAWDCDVNLFGSKTESGSTYERFAMRELIRDFQKQPGAQLWIYRGQIANRDVDNWRVRSYTGANPHDKHCHFQSRPTHERTSYVDEVLPATNKETDMPSVDDLLNADKIANDVNPGVKGQAGYNPEMSVKWALRYAARAELARQEAAAASKKLDQVLAALGQVLNKDFTDEDAIAAAVIAALPSAQAIADAIPAGVAQEVVELLAARMAT